MTIKVNMLSNVKHILSNAKKQKIHVKNFYVVMLNMNKDVAYTRALTCTNVTDKKLVNTYLKLDVDGEVKSVWPLSIYEVTQEQNGEPNLL